MSVLLYSTLLLAIRVCAAPAATVPTATTASPPLHHHQCHLPAAGGLGCWECVRAADGQKTLPRRRKLGRWAQRL
jgi:hypothetical protein